jgi:hypothetical protein
VDTYRIYDSTDENGIVGTVAPGLFAQKGRCWRMVYENPVGQAGTLGLEVKAGEQVNRRARSGVDGLRGCLDRRGTQLERDCER